MTPTQKPVPRRVNARTLQRLDAIRAAIPPVYDTRAATKPPDPAPEEQFEFAWESAEVAKTQSDQPRMSGTPWNRGRLVGAKLPLKPKHVWALRFHLHREKQIRDLAMFDLAIDSKLRGCDLIKLKIGDLILDGQPKLRATVIQQKTRKPVTFELTEQTCESLLAWPRRSRFSRAFG